MVREKKLVTLSLGILFFSLIVVYSLFYQVKGKDMLVFLKQAQTSIPSVDSGVNDDEVVVEDHLDKKPLEENLLVLEGESSSDITAGYDAIQGQSGGKQIASAASRRIEGDEPIILSGTDYYFGIVDSIELLGLSPRYVLKDYKGFFYARLDEEPDLRKVVQRLGGNTYVINSDAEMVKNNLFGDKIIFVNLPEYRNKIVVMILCYDGQYWLMQMNYEKYHHAKDYLKSLFD